MKFQKHCPRLDRNNIACITFLRAFFASDCLYSPSYWNMTAAGYRPHEPRATFPPLMQPGLYLHTYLVVQRPQMNPTRSVWSTWRDGGLSYVPSGTAGDGRHWGRGVRQRGREGFSLYHSKRSDEEEKAKSGCTCQCGLSRN